MGHGAEGRGVINSLLCRHMIRDMNVVTAAHFDKLSCKKACHLAAMLATNVTRGGTTAGPFRATAILSASGVSKYLPTNSVCTALTHRSRMWPSSLLKVFVYKTCLVTDHQV